MSSVYIKKTRDIPNPNEYVLALQDEFAKFAFDEEAAPVHRGHWRDQVFEVSPLAPLDLEIGTGNGYHFSHFCQSYPDRQLIGIEIKYKPLIQSVRRMVRAGCENGRMVRYHARAIKNLFAPAELDNIYIHFPDPWPKKKHHKNRLVRRDFLKDLFELQKPGAFVEFKTDSQTYFDFATEEIEASPYRVEFMTRDLHRSERRETNYVTQFETYFLRESLPIYYALLRKPGAV